MKILLLTIFTFLLVNFIIYLWSYLKGDRYNLWISGRIQAISVEGENEIWTISWRVPEKYKKFNPGPEQFFYFTTKHKQKFSDLTEENKYLFKVNSKNVGKRFYLALKVDAKQVIRKVGKYDGYLQKTVCYGLALIAFTAVTFWLLK